MKPTGTRRVPKPSGPIRKDGFRRATAEEIRLRRTIIAEAYAENKTPEQIAAELDLPANQVTNDISYILESLARYYGGQPPEHTFVRYALFQTRLIRNLQHAADLFLGEHEPQLDLDGDPVPPSAPKQFSSYMTAMKTQSDIMDKIVEKGLDFGVIKRRKANQLVGSTTKVVMQEVHREVILLQSLLEDVGGTVTSPHLLPQTIEVSSSPYPANDKSLQVTPTVTRSRKQNTPPIRTRKPPTIRLIRKVKRDRNGRVMRAVQDWKKRKPRRQPSKATQAVFDQEIKYLTKEASKGSSKPSSSLF